VLSKNIKNNKKDMTLTKRIKDIRLILNRPYFFVNLYPNKSIVIVFESEKDDEERFTFTGPTLKAAIEEAERWIKHEQEMGSLKNKKTSEGQKTQEESKTPPRYREEKENEK